MLSIKDFEYSRVGCNTYRVKKFEAIYYKMNLNHY